METTTTTTTPAGFVPTVAAYLGLPQVPFLAPVALPRTWGGVCPAAIAGTAPSGPPLTD